MAETNAGYLSDPGSTKDTPYLALAGELWGVFCEYLGEKWPRYNGTALYMCQWIASVLKGVMPVLPGWRQT